MVPSKIKIESFAKRCHMGTLGGKGLNVDYHEISVALLGLDAPVHAAFSSLWLIDGVSVVF